MATHPDGCGMRTLDAFGFGICTTRLCDAVPARAVKLDYDSRCHGYWLPAVTYGDETFDTSLLSEDWRPGKSWGIDTLFKATVKCSRDGSHKLIYPAGCEVQWTEGPAVMTGIVKGFEGSHHLSVWPHNEQVQIGLFAELVLSADAAAVMVVPESNISSVTYSISRPYRSTDCAWFCVDTLTGAKRPNLMCLACSKVPTSEDFKARLIKRAAPSAHQESIRFDRLPTVPLIIEHARQTQAAKKHYKISNFVARKMLGRSHAREKSMRERLDAQLLTGDLAGLAADLKYCQDHNKFAGRQVMLNFVKDLAHDARLKKPDGRSNPNMRWHESTKRLSGVLKKFGGPRCHRLLRLNVSAPSVRTVGRCWNRDIFRYSSGDIEATFVQLAKELKPQVALLKLADNEKLPCEFQFDETPILQELSYSRSRDSCGFGSCGWGGEDHRCDPEFPQRPECIIGDDDQSAAKIERLCADAVRAGYLRLALLKPLSKKLPRMIASLSATCNRFNTVHVQEQWVRLDEFFDKHIAPLGFTRSTHGSDGDARYFAAQKANMTGKVTWASGEATSHWADLERSGVPFRIEHEGFTLSGLRLPDGTITNIEIQDSRHCVKKLVSWMFVGQNLRRGDSLVTANHCVLVFERFQPHRHRIRKQDAERHDPQDFVGPMRLSSSGTRECLKVMQAVHTSDFNGQQYEPVKTEGTIEYLDLIANFTRIHLGVTLSNLERVFYASDILNDLRFWRNHLHYTPGFTLKEHFMSRQTFEHVTLECHSVCLHIKMFGVQCPSQPTDLEESGSDECEKTFRSFGGFSRSQGRRRNYTFLEAIDGASDENQLNMWETDTDPELRLEYGRGNITLEYDETLHEPSPIAGANLADHPDAAALIDAFERGLQSARRRAVTRGMVLKGQLKGTTLTGEELMQKPWLGEGQLVAKMRDKDDAEAEQEAGGDDGGSGGGAGSGVGGGAGLGANAVADGAGAGGDDGGSGGGASSGAGRGAGSGANAVADGAGDHDSDDDGDGLPPPPGGGSGDTISAAAAEREREAATDILDAVLEMDSDWLAANSTKPIISPMLTVTRDAHSVRVYKRTYLAETQQMEAGKKLPTSRLEKISAAAKQTSREAERTVCRSGDAGSSSDDVSDSAADSPQLLRLGSVVGFATCTDAGTYAWWAGRIEKMKCKSSKSGKYIATTTPMPFDEACAEKVQVVCTWYKKHSGYVFTYDGPIDDAPYSMENALGLLDLELPDDRGKYRLRDPAQGPQLDAALKLTERPNPGPSGRKKRTRGEEILALEAQEQRERAAWAAPAAAKKPRKAPTVRIPT